MKNVVEMEREEREQQEAAEEQEKEREEELSKWEEVMLLRMLLHFYAPVIKLYLAPILVPILDLAPALLPSPALVLAPSFALYVVVFRKKSGSQGKQRWRRQRPRGQDWRRVEGQRKGWSEAGTGAGGGNCHRLSQMENSDQHSEGHGSSVLGDNVNI